VVYDLLPEKTISYLLIEFKVFSESSKKNIYHKYVIRFLNIYNSPVLKKLFSAVPDHCQFSVICLTKLYQSILSDILKRRFLRIVIRRRAKNLFRFVNKIKQAAIQPHTRKNDCNTCIIKAPSAVK
jgi:hypothetical protein